MKSNFLVLHDPQKLKIALIQVAQIIVLNIIVNFQNYMW